MDTEQSSSPDLPGPPPADIEARLQTAVEEFLAALQAGERPDRAQAVAEQPELAPWLDERLKLVELVFQAAQDGDADGRHLPGDRAKRLKCPHCGNQVQLVEPRSKEVTCFNCGSSFRVEPDATATYQSSRPAGEFGRFQVIELLGRGAFGEVYKARDRELDRFVALKVPRADYFANSEETQRFLREARAAAGLRHASIVQVHEIAHERGSPYIVSDYIEGLTLADLISGGRPGFRESAELLAQLADAVDYAHRQKVIHRDIKPSNILLTVPEGKHAGDPQFVPFLTDFGLARRDEGEITVTLDGQVLGTPAYMSPEQAAGDHARVDGRSDVYSLGVVLYELLSGELPFRGSRRMLLHQVLHDEPRPPRTLNDRIPRDLETICLKAMTKEPGRRYHTAAGFRDDLRRFLRGDPITARRVGRTERAWRWCRRNPVVAGLSSMAILLLVAVATVSTLAYLRETKLVGEKDELIRDKDELITEKEGLIQEKDREVTRADTQTAVAQRRLYAAHMKLVQSAWESDNITQVLGLLDQQRPGLGTPDLRGFEWHYWNRQSHSELSSRKLVPTEPFTTANRVILNSHGTQAAAGVELEGEAGYCIVVWDALTGRERNSIAVDGPFMVDEFSPDNTQLAISRRMSFLGPIVVKVFEVATGREIFQASLPAGPRSTRSRFSPDGRFLAKIDMSTLKVWEIQSRSERLSIPANGMMADALAFSGDGKWLAAALRDSATPEDADSEGLYSASRFILDLQTGQRANVQKGFGKATAFAFGQPGSFAFSPDGTRFAILPEGLRIDQELVIASTQDERPPLRINDHTQGIDYLNFSPDAKLIAGYGRHPTIKVWDAGTGILRHLFRGMSSG